MKLHRAFFLRPTLQVAEELLGKVLVHETPFGKISGEINEVESYIGQGDLASHAARGKTARNALMFGMGGFTYIYFIYGMYFCLNIVTEKEGYPAAILIRSVIPKEGVDLMLKNNHIFRASVQKMMEEKPLPLMDNSAGILKNRKTSSKLNLERLTNGPGKLCLAYGLNFCHQGIDLTTSSELYVEENGKVVKDFSRTPRIGIAKGKEKLWRFVYQ